MAELETVTQRLHIRIGALHQLEGVGHNSNGPRVDARSRSSLEAEIEVPRVLGVEAESVHRSLGVGFDIRRQPFLCETKLVKEGLERLDKHTCIHSAALLVLVVLHHLINLPSHGLDVVHNQLVKIAVIVLSANAKLLAN